MEITVVSGMSSRNEPAEHLARHFGIRYRINTQEDNNKISLYLRVMNNMTLDLIQEKLPLVYTRNPHKSGKGDYNSRVENLIDFMIDNKLLSSNDIAKDPYYLTLTAKMKMEHLFHILPDYTLAQFEQQLQQW